MSPTTARVLMLGASGYTGRLTALALARRGLRPVLLGRSRERLEAVIGELLAAGSVAGGLDVVDVGDPTALRRSVAEGDVLVTTVGPFVRLGEPAARAAIDARAAAYIDSTGEPPFVRRVFEEWSAPAESAGVALITAFGYDYVPGNLAAAHVVRDCVDRGAPPVRVDVGYFVTGAMGVSGGTAASALGVLTAPQFRWADARLATVRGGERWRGFEVDGRVWDGVSIGASEHFAVPRLCPSITEVNAYLGWAGSRSRTLSRLSGALALAARVPGVPRAVAAAGSRGLPAPGTGPTAEERSRSGTLAVAEAFDGVGRPLGRAVVTGPSPYDLTAELLAWAADEAATGRLAGTGALGPADAFGGPGAPAGDRVTALIEGCASLGLVRTG